MSNIINSSLFSGGYYPLSSTNQSNATNNQDALLQALGASSGNSSSSVPTDFLDLSPEAQKLLAQINGSGNGSDSVSKNGFILTPKQQQQIRDILEKYKDAPFTQETFNQIQNDLKAAGLSPDKLAAVEQIHNFNSTGILLDALNGVDSSANFSDFFNNGDAQEKANNYMKQIVSAWQSISTTAPKGG